MKNLLWFIVLGALTAFGAGKDIYGNNITNSTLIGNVDGELTTVGDINTLKIETDPTVPSWAKMPEKPVYNAGEVGARPNNWMPSAADVGALPNNQDALVGNQNFSNAVINTSGISAESNARAAGDAALDAKIATKQTNLVSGVNIKTINGETVLGRGDIIIQESGGGGVNTNAVRDLIAPATNAVFAAATNAVMARVEEKRDLTNRVWSVVDRWNGEGITSLENTYGVLRKTEYFNNGNGWCIPLYFGDMEYWFAFIVKEYEDGNLVYFDTEDEARNATSGWSIFTEGWIFHPATRTVSIDNLALSSEIVSATNNAVRWSTIDGDKRIILNEGRDSEWNFIGFLRTEQNDGLYLHTGETIFFDNTFGEASTLTPDGTPLVTEDKMNAATNGLATANALAAVSNNVVSVSSQVSAIGAYLNAEDARFVSTNYNSVTQLPEAYVEIKLPDQSWSVIWREMTRWNWLFDTHLPTNFYNKTQVNAALAEKADRAWGAYDSETGGYAPDGYTWLSSPRIAIAGGLAYQKTLTSEGAVWVLESNGTSAETSGVTSNGFFRISDDEGNVQFEIVKGTRRTVGADASSVQVVQGFTPTKLQIGYSVVSDAHPLIYVSDNITNDLWKAETDADCLATVTWSGSSGAWVAQVQGKTAQPALFVKASYETGAESVIRNAIPVQFSHLYLGGVKYAVGTATISGQTVLTLTPAP